MKTCVCLLTAVCGLSVQAAPAPLPRPKPPAPATEVVVTLFDGGTPAQRVEVAVGARKFVVRGERWDLDLTDRLRQLRADPKTPDLLVTVCDRDSTPAKVYFHLFRTCRDAGFARISVRVGQATLP